MRTVTALLVLTCLATQTTEAQEKQQSAEVGTSLGVTILTAGGSTITTIGIPVDAGPLPLFARPAIYATIFATPSLMIEPQVALSNLSGGSGGDFTIVLLAAQVGYLFNSVQRQSPYFAANVAFQSLSAGGSASGVGVGGALGYRFRIGRGFALRVVGQYRRWFGDYASINEIGLALGLGGII